MNIYMELEKLNREVNYLKTLLARNDIKIVNSSNELTTDELAGGFIGLDRSETSSNPGGQFFIVDNGKVLTIG